MNKSDKAIPTGGTTRSEQMKKAINRMMLAAALTAGAAIMFSDTAAATEPAKTKGELSWSLAEVNQMIDEAEAEEAAEKAKTKPTVRRSIPTVVFEGPGLPFVRKIYAVAIRHDLCRLWAKTMLRQLLMRDFVQLPEFDGNHVINVSKIQYIHCDVIGY